MSVNYNAYHLGSYPTKRIRQELEKFHNTLPKRENFHFNPSSSTLSINFIDWDDLQGVEYSENSSTPSFFCQFSFNQACTVKGVSNTVEELFTSSLQQILNIHTLKSRLIQFKQSEFQKMINSLQRVAIGDKYLENAILKELDRPFILVQEFKPATYFLQMGKKRSEHCFESDPQLGYRRLREIGEIIAVDILLNNPNRVPIIWTSEGNSNTFLITIPNPPVEEEDLLDSESPVTFGNIYAIDSNFISIENTSDRLQSQYLEKVERFIRGTLRDLDDALQGKTFGLMNIATMESVKDFFYKCTRIELGNHQLFQILKGIMGTFKEIAEMENEEIEDIYQELKLLPEEDWMDLWQQGLLKLNMEFLFAVKAVIKNLVAGNNQSFTWVYQMYKIDESPLYL